MHTPQTWTKMFCVALILIPLFIATPALAEIDQRCMTQTDCQILRAGAGVSENTTDALEAGFLTRSESNEARRNCPEEMVGLDGQITPAGLCLASQAAETKIAIGGKTQYASLAEYIAYIYRYSMIIAGALCVLLFIVAGIEWTLSGGDGHKIDEAKTHISNATTGLILMATSYVVLYTIDPSLTSLKPPEVYLIRGVNAFDPWCGDLSNNTLPLAFARDLTLPNNQRSTVTNNTSFDIRRDTAACGNEYHIGNTGQYCKGQVCQRNYACTTNADNIPTCVEGNVVGTITSNNLFEVLGESNAETSAYTAARSLAGIALGENGWVWPWLNGWTLGTGIGRRDIKIVEICSDGSYQDTNSTVITPAEEQRELETKTIYYQLRLPTDFLSNCSTDQNGDSSTIGFALWVDLNELKIADVISGSARTTCIDRIWGYLPPLLFVCGVGNLFDMTTTDEQHLIGRNGVDLYSPPLNDAVARCYLKKIDTQQLFTLTEIQQGLPINIVVNDIADIDNPRIEKPIAYGTAYEQCWQSESQEGQRETSTQQCSDTNLAACTTACRLGDPASCAVLCRNGQLTACGGGTNDPY
jgi:hypothetical protein